jgi:hypothetical protein
LLLLLGVGCASCQPLLLLLLLLKGQSERMEQAPQRGRVGVAGAVAVPQADDLAFGFVCSCE